MQPTNELRFVEREITTPHPKYVHVTETKTVKVLQQKWARYWSEDMGGGERKSEWLDVETVKE